MANNPQKAQLIQAQMIQAGLADKQLREEFGAKIPLTLNDERLGCDTFFHPKLSVGTGNTVFCIFLKDDKLMKMYMLVVMHSNGYAIYWVQNSKESMLADFSFGTEDLMDAFLQLFLLSKF